MALWVTFWGTRGSIPVSLDSASIRDKLAHAIVAASGKRLDTQEKARAWVDSELDFAVRTLSGAIPLACSSMRVTTSMYCAISGAAYAPSETMYLPGRSAKANVFHVFQSHLHWDHIMGFPFFAPAYVPGNRIRIYGCHTISRSSSPPTGPAQFPRAV